MGNAMLRICSKILQAHNIFVEPCKLLHAAHPLSMYTSKCVPPYRHCTQPCKIRSWMSRRWARQKIILKLSGGIRLLNCFGIYKTEVCRFLGLLLRGFNNFIFKVLSWVGPIPVATILLPENGVAVLRRKACIIGSIVHSATTEIPVSQVWDWTTRMNAGQKPIVIDCPPFAEWSHDRYDVWVRLIVMAVMLDVD